MIDYMKETKILYLADVLEDIAKEMERDFHNRPFCKSINDIVKELRDTLLLTIPTNPANMREERIQIKRIENRDTWSPPCQVFRTARCRATRTGVEDISSANCSTTSEKRI